MADSFQRVFAGTSSLNAVVERADEAILFIAVGVEYYIIARRFRLGPTESVAANRRAARRYCNHW